MTLSRSRSRFSSAVAALLLSACADAGSSTFFLDDGPRPGCADGARETQRHGTACLCCHADEFGVAGSIDPEGPEVARIVVTDGDGNVANMVPNGFDNFFRHLRLTPPLTATVYGKDGQALSMKDPASSGDCNACHRPEGSAAPLRGPQ